MHYFLSQFFFDLEEIIFENFNIFENNIISVELAKELRYIIEQIFNDRPLVKLHTIKIANK
jgi:hypothetical protein